MIETSQRTIAEITSPVSSAQWSQLCEVMNGYVYSQILVTACDLDLFSLLSERPGATQQHISELLHLSPHSTRVLLLGASAAGLIVREAENGGYHNSELAEKVLVAGSPYSIIPFIQFNQRIQQRCISRLTQALKENRNAGLDEFPGGGATLYERLAGYPELERLFQEAMAAYTRLAPKVLEFPELSSVRHLLDVGGGDGSNAMRLCERFPSLRVTILDIPSVIQIARESVDGSEFAGRISFTSADMFVDRWPADCDAILFSHVVEIFSPEKIRALYAKAYSNLPKGGTMFVWTLMSNDSETGALQAAKSSIYFLAAASGEGMAYPGSDHERLIREVGFTQIRRHYAEEVDHGGLIAKK
jgi:hypothetical protein